MFAEELFILCLNFKFIRVARISLAAPGGDSDRNQDFNRKVDSILFSGSLALVL